MSRVRRRPHLAWGVLGAVAAASLWYAWSLPGALGMFVSIGLAFVMWNRLGSRGAWVAVAVLGVGMSGVLGWQAVTGSRCPAAGTKVFLQANRPPIDCGDVRKSAGVMSFFFGLVAIIGVAAPIYVRSLPDADDDPIAG